MKLAPAVLALVLSAGLAAPSFAAPQAAAPAAAPAAKAKYSVETTPLLDLMHNAKTKPILQKALADFYGQLEDNEGMIPPDFTLKTLQEYAGGALSEDALKTIQAEFDKL